MVSKETLLAVLPVENQTVLIEDRQNTLDIRDLILEKHIQYAPEYDLISAYFDKGDIIDTSREIFDFLKANVPYTKEGGKVQSVKSPALILTNNAGSNNFDRVDCKNYASFIAGIIDSLKRRDPNSEWDWTYRFASYDPTEPEPAHVFVVVKKDGAELWIDPVFDYFNSGDLHEWEIDEKPIPSIGGLYSISGIEDSNTVIVNSDVAWISFLQWVQLNLFDIRTLLTRNLQVTTTALKELCHQNGFDYQQLMRFLVYG